MRNRPPVGVVLRELATRGDEAREHPELRERPLEERAEHDGAARRRDGAEEHNETRHLRREVVRGEGGDIVKDVRGSESNCEQYSRKM